MSKRCVVGVGKASDSRPIIRTRAWWTKERRLKTEVVIWIQEPSKKGSKLASSFCSRKIHSWRRSIWPVAMAEPAQISRRCSALEPEPRCKNSEHRHAREQRTRKGSAEKKPAGDTGLQAHAMSTTWHHVFCRGFQKPCARCSYPSISMKPPLAVSASVIMHHPKQGMRHMPDCF